MKHLFIFLVTLLCTWPTASAQMSPLTNTDELHARLAREAEKLQSIESDFTQQKYLDVFDETITSKGKFYFKKENKVCMEYSKPLNYLIVIDGSRLKTVSDGKTSIVNLSTNKMMNQMQEMLTACMVGDLSRLSADYELAYYEDPETYLIVIKPTNKQVLAYIVEIEIHLSKTDMSVDKLRLAETETNFTEYIFKNKRFNTLTDEKVFEIN